MLCALTVFTFLPAHASPRRRAAPSNPPGAVQPGTPAEWLATNATPLTTVELSSDRSDLAPLRSIVGDASIVGLGDATHGTHEFYAVKLRIIDYLVRELGFDVIAFEGAFPLFEQINVYVKGGPGDPRALLNEARLLDYVFWDVEEFLAVVEWMRDYNLHRGTKPVIEIAGTDIFDHVTAAAAVVSYLQTVDPGAAQTAQQNYACVMPGNLVDPSCGTSAQRVLDAIASRSATYVPITGQRAYDDAVQYATVTRQLFIGLGGVKRDASMATNALWILQHRGAARKMMLWGHQEHIARFTNGWVGGKNLGQNLSEAIGSRYAVIGTIGAEGTFGAWGVGKAFRADPLPPVAASSYESFFTQSPASALLIPLRRVLPDWLSATRTYRTADWGGFTDNVQRNLAQAMDAVVYVRTTSAVRPLVH